MMKKKVISVALLILWGLAGLFVLGSITQAKAQTVAIPLSPVDLQTMIGPKGSQAQPLSLTQVGVVTISIIPSPYAATEGESFPVDIQVEAGDYEVLGVSAHLDFDPTFLEVEGIANGDLHAYALTQWDNVTGTIDVDGAMLGTTISDTFTVATINLKALDGASGQTKVTFVTEGARETRVSYGAGQDHIVIPQDGTVTVGESSCTISYDKTASPAEVDAGGVATVTLSLQAIGACDAASSPVDAMLVLDRSGSMRGQAISDSKTAAITFVNLMSLPPDQVGVASFASSGSGTLDSPLTQDGSAAVAAINGLSAIGMTNVEEGLEIAETELITSGRHITTHIPLIVILSDGRHNESTPGELQETADRIKSMGIRIISIGLGNSADENQLQAIASSTDDYYYAPTSSDLADIYQKIASTVRTPARNMVITDTLSSYVSLAHTSFRGPVAPTVSDNVIVWRVAAVPTSALTLAYQVVMTDAEGIWDTNASASATYIDASGNDTSFTFPVPQVTVHSQCGRPTLNAIQPAWGCVGEDVPVSLLGGGFVNPTASIGAQALTIHTFWNNSISAALPASLGVGVYDVGVVNECAYNATLPGAFTLYRAPSVLSVRPSEGYSDKPSDITICGEAFAPGTEVFIEDPVSGTLSLENQAAYGETCLVGTAPEDLQPGEHIITVQGPCGEVTATYHVLSEMLNDDLWGMPEELWVAPSICARECDEITMGLVVHRRGGKDALQNVAVRFYEGDPGAGVVIGVGTIPLFPPRAGASPSARISGFSTTALDWTPSQGVMSYTLYAVIDPDGAVTEDIEDNNVVSRTVQVLPCGPGVDSLAPHVDGFSIKGGADTTYDVGNPLSISASDTLPGPCSGVANMNFVEYLFNEAAAVWIPVQVSGWQSYTQTADWDLYPEGGMRFLQAWVSDGAGNISLFPYFQYINYIKPCAAVSRDGVRIYRQHVQEGDWLHVEVAPCSGDPDLYVWPPYWEEGVPPWVSNGYGDAIERLSIPITTTGDYQIEVYGYTAAQYNVNIEVEPASSARMRLGATRMSAPSAAHAVLGKFWRSAPAMPPDSTPGTNTIPVEPAPLQPSASYQIYLPLVVRDQ
jgi:Mg-chelatase subunit ChlD